MGKYAYDLYNSLKNTTDVDLLKNTHSSKNPLFFFEVIVYLFKNIKKYSHIHICDGVLSPIGFFTKIFTNKKTSITIHALDIIYDFYLYQCFIPFFISKHDHIICVSHFTLKECIKRKIEKKRCMFIPNGINYNEQYDTGLTLDELAEKYNINLKNRKVLFSICRLIKRKGITWFTENVFLKLSQDYVYIIAGTGPEMESLSSLIQTHNLDGRVFLLGKVTEQEKICLYKNSFLFIMPNIKIKNDAEGFGITIIEAASYGLPCIASNMEGISDAIIDGITGKLIKPEDRNEYIKQIENYNFEKKIIQKETQKHFDWEVLIKSYLAIFN